MRICYERLLAERHFAAAPHFVQMIVNIFSAAAADDDDDSRVATK